MQLPNFALGSYEAQSRIAAGSRTINLYSERIPRGNKVQGALYPIHGLSSFGTASDAPGRGVIFEQRRCFAVFGSTLSEFAEDGSETVRGDVGSDSNPVTMWTSGDAGQELFIVAGGAGHILNLTTNTLTTDVVANVRHGAHLDGFFLGLDPDTSTLKICEFSDGLTWDATQIAQRASASDPWQAMVMAGQEIFLLGDKTGDVWFNAGLSPFPFAPRPGAFFEVGIAAPFSLALFGQTLAWLGQTTHGISGVYLMAGYQPRKISTPAIDWAIQQYSEGAGVSDAIGWSYGRDGHEFYILTFPAAGKTWAYDLATNDWHERAFWSATDGEWMAYRPVFHAKAFGKNLVCDSAGNGLYHFSSTVYTDIDGSGLRRVRRMPHVASENRRIIFPWAELEAERGVGTSGGSTPEVNLRHSNDGGWTWGVSRARSLGKIGEYNTRVRWNQCGAGRDRVWELWQTDAVASRWLDFYFGAR